MTVDPKVAALVEKHLLITTTSNLTALEATEIFLRCLMNVALDAGRGDRAVAAKFMDEVIQPWLTHARTEYAKGGKLQPKFVHGQRVN